MSKKRSKKTANKSLETLKRKQYVRGGRGGMGLAPLSYKVVFHADHDFHIH